MTDIKIDPATKDLWVPALEGGTFQQCANHLYNGDDPEVGGYCCLGVLAKVKGANFYIPIEEGEDEDGNVVEYPSDEGYTCEFNGRDINDSDLLDQTFADTMGLSKYHQELLSALNDGTATTVRNDNPLISVWRAVCDGETDSVEIETYGPVATGNVYKRRFLINHKRSFAEIAAVIKEHF